MYKILNGLIAVPVSDLSTPADERSLVGIKNHSSTLELTPRWDKIPFCTKPYPIGIIFRQLLLNPDQYSFQEPTERLVWSDCGVTLLKLKLNITMANSGLKGLKR